MPNDLARVVHWTENNGATEVWHETGQLYDDTQDTTQDEINSSVLATLGTHTSDISLLQSDIGIVVTGKRAPEGVTVQKGQYVIVKNSTITNIPDGLYTANAQLPSNADITAANLTAVTEGGLNSLRNSMPKYKILLSSVVSVPNNSETQFTLTENEDNYSLLSVILYDSNYIRASTIVPRTPGGIMDTTFFGVYGGATFAAAFKLTSGTTGTITQASGVSLSCNIRGIKI